MFNARREASSVASAAARAGAADVDIGQYRWDQTLRLEGTAAGRAQSFAMAAGASSASARIVTEPGYATPGGVLLNDLETVEVDVTISVRLFFLGPFLGTPTVQGEGRARPTHPEEGSW